MSSSDDDEFCSYTSTTAFIKNAYKSLANAEQVSMKSLFSSEPGSYKKSANKKDFKLANLSDDEEDSKPTPAKTEKPDSSDFQCGLEFRLLPASSVKEEDEVTNKDAPGTPIPLINSLSDNNDNEPPSDIPSILSKIDACLEASKMKRGRKRANTAASGSTPKREKGRRRVPRGRQGQWVWQQQRTSRRARNPWLSFLFDNEAEDANLPPLFAKQPTKKVSPEEASTSLAAMDEANAICIVNVWWRSEQIDKFEIRKFQSLDTIFKFYSHRENVTEDKLLFTLKDRDIKKEDTPDSLDLMVNSIIEGGIVTNAIILNEEKSSKTKSKNCLELKIQQKNVKKPSLVTIQKGDNMATLLVKVSEQMKLPLNSFKLYMDGDVINPLDKPEDLDLEGGECLDLKLSEND